MACSDPFADLLLSPRAAFVWDRTRRGFAWMNAGARARFGLREEELQARLAAPLAQCFDAAQGKGKASGAVKLKAGRHAAVSCFFEITELAGGHRGLIVSEAAGAREEPDAVRLPAPRYNKTAPKPPAEPKATPKQRAPSKPAPAQLTPEELRAFKSIGRTVRRLAREKQHCAGAASGTISARAPRQDPAAGGAVATPDSLFSAFDLVLFLDEDFAIRRIEGRTQLVGWRKSKLLGRPAEVILTLPEQAIFRRMIGKLGAGTKVCREAVVLSGEAGGSVPCRAVLGRWPNGNARYFLAVLSLSLPARLKRLPAFAQTMRLAA